MKKILVIISLLLFISHFKIYAQDFEKITNELTNASKKATYLKDFKFELEPNSTVKYSLVLSKGTKYEFAIYQNNSDQFNFELYKENSEENLITEKYKFSDQIIMADFSSTQTGVYHIVVKNNSSEKAKSVLLLSFIEEKEKTIEGNDKIKTDSNKNKTNTFENEDTYVIVEQMPYFGGEENREKSSNLFREFLAKNIIYPEEAKAKKIKGRVYVSFTVDKEGYIKSAKVIRGVHPALDQEALRVILSSPRWEPGKEKGKPVNVTYTMPIIFELN